LRDLGIGASEALHARILVPVRAPCRARRPLA
jgi:hypothetical protein